MQAAATPTAPERSTPITGGRASGSRSFVRKFMRSRTGVFGLAILSILVTISVLAPLVSNGAPDTQSLAEAREGPSAKHWMGTDQLGRDIWTRVVYGGRISLFLSVVVVAIGTVTGTVVGAAAGYYGGIIDTIVMRIVDIMLAFPSLILALAIAASLGSGMRSVIIAATVGALPGKIRIVRSVVLSVKRSAYVDSGRSLGASDARLIFRHVIPNSMTPVIISATLQLSTVLLLIAGLGFLGLGVKPPTPEWGTMVAEGRAYLRTSAHIVLMPGFTLMFAVLGFNLAGDALRDALDAKNVG